MVWLVAGRNQAALLCFKDKDQTPEGIFLVHSLLLISGLLTSCGEGFSLDAWIE